MKATVNVTVMQSEPLPYEQTIEYPVVKKYVGPGKWNGAIVLFVASDVGFMCNQASQIGYNRGVKITPPPLVSNRGNWEDFRGEVTLTFTQW